MKALIKVQLSKGKCVSWRILFVYTCTIQKESFLVKSNIHPKALVKVQKTRYRCFCSRRKNSQNNFAVQSTVLWSCKIRNPFWLRRSDYNINGFFFPLLEFLTLLPSPLFICCVYNNYAGGLRVEWLRICISSLRAIFFQHVIKVYMMSLSDLPHRQASCFHH